MHKLKIVLVALLELVFFAALASCSDTANERIGERGEAINGGAPVSNPQNTRYVWIQYESMDQQSPTAVKIAHRGTGTLVRQDLVLTAAHNLDLTNCHQANQVLSEFTGNTQPFCFFIPSSYTVYSGNINTPPVTRAVRNVFVHPQFRPNDYTSWDTGVDVALLQLESPFSIPAFTEATVSSSAASTYLNQQIDVYGYGWQTTSNTDPTLRKATLKLEPSLNAVNDFVTDPTTPVSNGMTMHADSGASYLTSGGTVIGVHKAGEYAAGQTVPSHGNGVPSSRFSSWYAIVKDAYYAVNFHADFDTTPDTYVLSPSVNVLGTNYVGIKILSSQYGTLQLPLFTQPLTVSSFAFAAGDFNGDGIGEPVGVVNGQGFHFTSSPGNPSTFQSFSLPDNDYVKLTPADFNGDGKTDLEARRGDNWVDLLRGCSSGPTCVNGFEPAEWMSGFPILWEEEGIFATLNGPGWATVNYPSMRYKLTVPAAQTKFDLQIYDGDQSATYDRAGGFTCYKLYADKDDNGVADEVITIPADSSQYPDGKWKSIYSGAVHTSAKAPSGNYIYYLDIDLVAGTCQSPTPNNGQSMNQLAVRGTGDVVVVPKNPLSPVDARISLMARDSIGPQVPNSITNPGSYSWVPLHDTEYDGALFIPFYVASTTTQVAFTEADADDTLDSSEPQNFGPTLPIVGTDISSPGVADGKNWQIQYEIWDPNLQTVLTVLNPSGNYGNSGAQDVEQRSIAPSSTGWWHWYWSNWLTENNIHIWWPWDKTTGIPLNLGAGMLSGLSGSTAKTTDEWLSSMTTLNGFLPITLGISPNSVTVTSLSMATNVLRQNQAICGAPRPASELRELLAQLLAAKVNVARAPQFGENLANARIYALTSTVADAITTAERNLVLCNPTPAQRSLMLQYSKPLRDANDGDTTNRW